VEDSQPDSLLLTRALERGGFAPVTQRVDTAEAMERVLLEQPWDFILCDHAMPHFSAPEALELVKKHELDIPFIIVSGYIEEETAVAAMKAGAHDYIMKDRLARLVPAVERELREAEVRRARRETELELLRAQEELELRVEKRTSDLRAANIKLENVIEERKRLENELLEIAENERRRIGFDLHDDLGQKLTGLSLMIKGLEQKLGNERHPCLDEARKIQSLMDEIAHFTHNLARQFSSLDVKGDDLSSVLKGLAGNVKKMFGISCGFSVRGALPELPQHSMLQLYKIAQEAVSNAIKHGKASQVSLNISRDQDQLILTIKNDGLPFAQPATSKNRMGLRIMHYRASTIGASLEIKPLDKSGTMVTCLLPVNSGTRLVHRVVKPAEPDAECVEADVLTTHGGD
jgi:signal transduction histidine kinase